MTTVLVVDDSPVDRKLIRGLLQKVPDFDIDTCSNGKEALERIADSRPDLVITDLVMPEIDGIELITRLQSAYPSLPILVTTSKGSEEIAVQALEKGAASYVPKSQLADRLIETTRDVLAASVEQKSHDLLMQRVIRSAWDFELENDSRLFLPLVTFLQQGAIRMGICCETEKVRLGVALEEALSNAMFHGNLELDSELRNTDQRAYRKLFEERSQLRPYRDRRIYVTARFSRWQLSITVRDEGPGFDPSCLPDPTDPENLEKCSGRGLLLMRTFTDEILFNELGNEVTLLKRRREQSSAT